ncbi:MAG: hypothetical protein OHK0046_05130 [Anaerolineae bacterium]
MLAAFLLLAVAACQSSPRTEYLLEVTREVTVVVVVTATPPQESPAVTPSPETAVPLTEQATASEESVGVAATVDIFPTPTVNDIIVAEQLFERGRLFYIQPNDTIWLMRYGGDGFDQTQGTWSIESDTWEEGMPEIDPELTPPSDNLFQPERGFGKLWRENPDIQEALGWALEPEQGHVTSFQFFPGGEINDSGTYVPSQGTYTLRSRYGEVFIFNEADSTWGVAAAEQ